jgi:hypothetical protein
MVLDEGECWCFAGLSMLEICPLLLLVVYEISLPEALTSSQVSIKLLTPVPHLRDEMPPDTAPPPIRGGAMFGLGPGRFDHVDGVYHLHFVVCRYHYLLM